MSSQAIKSSHRRRKGLVTDVSGPQRNVCPGTLTPLSSSSGCFCMSGNQGRRCGQDTDPQRWMAEDVQAAGAREETFL